jgi:hypothetical protein
MRGYPFDARGSAAIALALVRQNERTATARDFTD